MVEARQGCTIGIYTREKGYELSISFTGLGGCTRFEWLGEHGQQVKQKLKECRRLSQEEYIRKTKSSRER